MTCGIVRSVYLYCEDKIEIEHVYVYTESVDDFSAQIRMDNRFKAVADNTYLHIKIISLDGDMVYDEKKLIVETEMYKSVISFLRSYGILTATVNRSYIGSVWKFRSRRK